jgi:hypothetical protein
MQITPDNHGNERRCLPVDLLIDLTGTLHFAERWL